MSKYMIIEFEGRGGESNFFKVSEKDFKNDSGVFVAENSDFQIEFTIFKTGLAITNAVDGYGFNRLADLKDKKLMVYKQVNPA